MTTREIAAPDKDLAPPLHMSYEEYLDWWQEDVRAEWANGEVIIHMPPFDVHQLVLNYLSHLLTSYVDTFELGEVFVASFEMRLRTATVDSSRQPDILVVVGQSRECLSRERLTGPADLAVEIVSRDSVRRDRHDKFHEYRQAGVREYWIIDPRQGRNRADFYRLDAQGQYELYATEEDERVESVVLPGFWLRPSWLWLDSRVPVMSAFFEICGLSSEQMQDIDKLLRARRGGQPAG